MNTLLLTLSASSSGPVRTRPVTRTAVGGGDEGWHAVATTSADAARRPQDQEALDRLREAERRARAANSPAARAQEKLEEAERKVSFLRVAAQLAAASGDKEALERIVREAATLAKHVALSARGLVRAGGAMPAGPLPLPVGSMAAQPGVEPAVPGSDTDDTGPGIIERFGEGGVPSSRGGFARRLRLLLGEVKQIVDLAEHAFDEAPAGASDRLRRRSLVHEGRASLTEGRMAAAEVEANGIRHDDAGAGGEHGAAAQTPMVMEPVDLLA